VKPQKFAVVALSLLGLSGLASAQTQVNDGALRAALGDELGRTMQKLALPGEAHTHFAAYTALDSEFYLALATHGAVTLESHSPSRSLGVNIRVGTPDLDSSNSWHIGRPSMGFGMSPLDDDYAALRRELWLSSDDEYKSALESLAGKKTALSARVKERSDPYPDFAAEPRHETVVPLKPFDRAGTAQSLKSLAERLSRVLAEKPGLIDSGAMGQSVAVRRRLLTSEQTWADEGHVRIRVSAYAMAQAEDGMQLRDGVDFTAGDGHALPSPEAMETEVRALVQRLDTFRAAPLAESGSAVVLFEGRAAAQLVRSLLAQRLSGAPPLRYVSADTDRTLGSRLGLEVVSPLLDVFDDPTLAVGPSGIALWGNYAADDEGVPAQRVPLIERGVLKTLLMSRAPRKEIRKSNGHYRLGRGPSIGTLIVQGKKPLTRARLIEQAQQAAQKRGPKTKVYIVRRLAPRHSLASRGGASPALDEAISVEQGAVAAEAYLLTGKKEQPVRGLTLEPLELRALKDILAVGDSAQTLNLDQFIGTSVVAPALLLSDIDVKRHEADNPKPPSYAPPQ
jgi:predicted Zn-dependent protease